ncbi:Beta-xylosidase, GH43 family [Tessaracoccus bendigoensis DSM 12906]|uniref:Beta-xylosidase, GH43 family n=1 Tax=Tessaracoccus bendigoensis DSM 12906 TaxID=1123357 RepID=A0A1M6G7B8_9ACTN|nr:LamG-like jellyroll fold domain-containing protein [Tessaracoccus bendigoensis]SHJ05836.1 Beta-xylosidase, GH43 family [Tessaracoccus bendigoensis DSM 12906]
MRVGRQRVVAALAAGALLLGTAPPQASAAAPDNGLVAEYLFNQSDGASVPNRADGSSFGPATVQNLQAGDWTGTSLRLRGGAKTSTGDWVELPDDLLVGATSATVTAEVKASAAMLNTFHFLWNIGNDSAATEYLFASLNCGSGRSPLVGLKTGGVERLFAQGSCGVTADTWTNVTSVVDGEAGTASLYLDGVRVATGAVASTPADVADQSLNTIGRAPWPDPLFAGSIASFRVYDRALTASEIEAVSATDAALNTAEIATKAQAVLTGLNLVDITTSTHLDLPTAGGKVTWSSSDPTVVAVDGTVNAPVAGQPGVEVELTATASVRGQSASQSIVVTVEPSTETAQQRVERLAQQYVVEPVVASGYELPTAPQGTTVAVLAVTGAVLSDGALTTDGDTAVPATVRVRVTDPATTANTEREFQVDVHPSGARTLLAYDRVPTTVAEANNADVALSMHLALDDGESWAPLNENYGIFFPKTASTPPASGTTEAILRSLRNPHLFRLADGTFGVVATRTARGGAADGTQASQVLFATSSDLLSYREVAMVNVGVSGGVNDPAAVWDSAAGHYVVSWTSDGGAPMYVTFGDLADQSTRGVPQRGSLPSFTVDGSGIANFGSGNRVVVSDEAAAALEVRFGRVTNTTVDAFDEVSIAKGSALTSAELPERADLTYSDGSTDTRAVEWDAADIAAVDTSTPGSYEVTGTVKQPTYPTPFADERADPSVFSFDWNGQQKFLMIATEDLNMNPIDPANGPHMPFRWADTIEDLSDDAIAAGRNTEVDLLKAGDTDAYGAAMTGCFWAPEFHVIDDTLSILFMPCYNGSNGRPDMWTGRASIIQLKKDAAGNDLDPSVATNWTKAERVVKADGSILNPIQNISLDMTYFEDSGQAYYSWQMLGSIFIAKMDPANPTRLTSEPVRIVVPEYAWDNTIAEGPNVHVRDGKLYLIYSGSTVGDSYTTGLAMADAGEGVDLTSPSAWTKLNYPIQKSGIFNGTWQLGTGHGMWSEDEDGNLLYVFHARTNHNGLSGRDTFVRRVHFAADGLPIFDLEANEEVSPGNRAVKVTVVVEAGTALDVEASVTTRCVAGRVTPVVRVTNSESVPVAVALAAPFGSKTLTVAAGRSSSAAFTVRSGDLAAGTLSVSAATEDGLSTAESSVAYEAASCS